MVVPWCLEYLYYSLIYGMASQTMENFGKCRHSQHSSRDGRVTYTRLEIAAFLESIFMLGNEEVNDASSTPNIRNDDTLLLGGDILLLHSR